MAGSPDVIIPVEECAVKTHAKLLSGAVLIGLVLVGCPTGPREREFGMTDADVALAWGITIFQEVPCGGPQIAGGEMTGEATFTGGLQRAELTMSSAWDIGNLLDDADKEFQPVSPHAAGPAAPVLGSNDYPHAFAFNPFTDDCLAPGETPVVATGHIVFTADGAELHGNVVGGETYRLDFVVPGDGIETFNKIEFDGGTGRFSGATGSFVVHSIFRYDHDDEEFVLELAEVLPGGTITY
jgi:hypothetical protein